MSHTSTVTSSCEYCPVRCKSLWCPDCGWKVSAKYLARLRKKGLSHESAYFLTLTVNRDLFSEGPEDTYRQIQRKGLVRKLIYEICPDKDRRWVIKFETDDRGWPHWHVIVVCTSNPERRVQQTWNSFANKVGQKDAINPYLGLVHCKPIPSQEDMERVLAYMVKPLDLPKDPNDSPRIPPAWILNSRQRVVCFTTSRNLSDGPGKRAVARRPQPKRGRCRTTAERLKHCGKRDKVFRLETAVDEQTGEMKTSRHFVGIVQKDDVPNDIQAHRRPVLAESPAPAKPRHPTTKRLSSEWPPSKQRSPGGPDGPGKVATVGACQPAKRGSTTLSQTPGASPMASTSLKQCPSTSDRPEGDGRDNASQSVLRARKPSP
jgi:hypothetical protein